MSFFGGTPVTVLSQSVTLTDAQIKTLPSAPVVIVPATQVLDYSGLPSQLPLPVAFSVVIDTIAGAYTNVDGGAFYVIAIGSDWSTNGMEADQNLMAGLQNAVNQVGIANSFNNTLAGAFIQPLNIRAGDILDNALAIALSNGGAGDLTGGNAANSMTVTVLYTIVDIAQ